MSIATDIYSLLEPYTRYPHAPAQYIDAMLHDVPKAPVAAREKYILEQCRDKRVVNFGSASGALHEAIRAVAKRAIGVDRNEPCDVTMDFEKTPHIKPAVPSGNDLLICGEVLEHLSNPGRFLEALREFSLPVILTVPNAFAEVSRRHMANGVENVNLDHVAWYSYRTMKTLLERHGFKIDEFCWYNGKPYIAEGLIFKVS
jgi:hypothetical protein